MSKLAEECLVQVIDKMVQEIMPLLAGKPPCVQGAVLADLVSMHIVGHAPCLREKILQMHDKQVRDLIPVNEAILFGPDGHPDKKGLQ